MLNFKLLNIHNKEVNKPYLAQHCFLKSLKQNDADPATWTNLGVFYLIHDQTGDNFLAHECFKKSQALDPEYGEAWIGQVGCYIY